jgi:hypothetical protein
MLNYIQGVNAAVERAVTTGASVSTLTKQILALDDKITKGRANFIARDQIGKLNGEITQRRMESVGLSMYIWETSGDERVRGDPGGKYPDAIPSHHLMDGLMCRWDNSSVYSEDGGKTWKPRPSGAVLLHPGQDYICRCTAIAYWQELVGEADGVIAEENGEVSISSNSFDDIRKLKTTDELIAYAGTHFQKLGEGTSRATFDMGNNRVLKVAKTDAGKNENLTEISIANLKSPFVFELYDSDKKGLWMSVEKLTPVSNSDLVYKNFTIRQLGRAMTEYEMSSDFGASVIKYDLEDFIKTPYFKKLTEFLDKNNLDIRDMMVVQNWGRTNDGRIVMSDVGLTRERFQERFGITETKEQAKQRRAGRLAAKKYVESL